MTIAQPVALPSDAYEHHTRTLLAHSRAHDVAAEAMLDLIVTRTPVTQSDLNWKALHALQAAEIHLSVRDEDAVCTAAFQSTMYDYNGNISPIYIIGTNADGDTTYQLR